MMLRYLTNKLRTQSLNEEQYNNNNKSEQGEQIRFTKTESDDSGTESDDESGDTPGFADNKGMDHDEVDLGGTLEGLFSPVISSTSTCDLMLMSTGGGRDSAQSQFESYLDSALPSDSDHAYDHHSSEEELEVINSFSLPLSSEDTLEVDQDTSRSSSCVRSTCGSVLGSSVGSTHSSSNVENKRKWSQIAANRLSVDSTSSEDDDVEIQGLLRPLSTPVEFCTSPPLDAHKPSRSASPPPKLFLFSPPGGGQCVGPVGAGGQGTQGQVGTIGGGVFRGIRRNHLNEPLAGLTAPCIGSQMAVQQCANMTTTTNSAVSETIGQMVVENLIERSHTPVPIQIGGAGGKSTRSGSGRESSRRRHRHHPHHPRHIQRPWLDFEKMQQLKARSVTTWRSGGELSLFCS